MTLVETLIVLVILVFGVLTVAQVFPGGFFVIRGAENSASAARLGQNLLESMKQAGAGLPEGVYVGYIYYNPTSGSVYEQDSFDPTVAPDNLGSYTAPPAMVARYQKLYGDCNKARFISNETVRVPASHLVGSSPYSLYLLNFGPIVVGNSSNPDVVRPYIQVTSAPWTAIAGDSTLSPTTGKPVDVPTQILHVGRPEFLIDYRAGMIALPTAGYTQYFTFVVSYQGKPYTLQLTVPATDGSGSASSASVYNGDWFSPGSAVLNYETSQSPPAPPTLSATSWDDGSARLNRPFTFIDTTSMTGTSYSSFFGHLDPYEFTLVDPNISGTVANIGVVGFNNAAASLSGTAPITARISYQTLDWHVIHEDFDLSQNGAATTIALTLRRLKKVGDVESDSSMYTGLFDIIDSPTIGNKFDVYIVDRDTGVGTSAVFDLDDAVPPYPAGDIGVSYQSGHLLFPDSYIGTSKKHVRIFYAAKDDWAVAIQKAPSTYVLNTDTIYYTSMSKPGLTGVNLYSFGPNPANTEFVYFPVSDEGKQVRFDRITYTNGGGQTVTKTAVLAQVSAATSLVQPGVFLPSVDLKKVSDVSDIDVSKPVNIPSVTGVSTKAMMIWRERGQWKDRTVDTMLLPPSTT
jgi:type II secretory pathway pseudopilin PulG